MNIKTPLLAVLILGAGLQITGIGFAFEHAADPPGTSEIVQSSQMDQETSALRRLALALSAGKDGLEPLRGSQNAIGQKDQLKLSIPGMACDIDRIVSYVSCYGSPIHTQDEAGRHFTELVDEFQSILPLRSWRKVKPEPRVGFSILSYTYADQESDASIDIDLIELADSYMVMIFGWTATGP